MAFELYVKRGCPFSEQAVMLLKKHGLAYTLYDVMDMGGTMPVVNMLKDRRRIPRNSGHKTVPIVFGPDGKFIGGCDSLASYLAGK